MQIGVTVICCSLLYSIMVGIVYFLKPKINNTENKIYSFLMKINIFGLLLELGCCFFVYNKDISSFYSTMNIFINKAFLIYLLLWEFTFTFYTFYISFSRNERFKQLYKNNKDKILLGIGIAYFLVLLLVVGLPLYYCNEGGYVYSYGPATDVLFIVGGISILVDNFCVFKNFKKVATKKYYPLFILILLMILVFVIREINPGLIVINSVFAFVTVLMYFTIENPDLQLVDELIRNREIVEKSIEDKSTFLFKMTEEVRNPLKKIIDNIDSYNITDDPKDKELYIDNVLENANNLTFIVNNILDISNMDINNIRITNSIYNAYTFFEDIRKKTLPETKKKNLEFRYEVSNNLPKFLYGDNVKLKQAIMSIILNAVKHTTTGFVDVDVNTIIRYDICRLIISVKDSGCGMSLEKINNILNQKGELTKGDLAKLNKVDVDLTVALKIIKILNGNVHIKSKLGEGTEFTIVLDQKIDLPKNNILDIKKYDYAIGKKILLVDDKLDEIRKIEDLLTTSSKDVINLAMLGSECIEKIKAGEKYDLIIINDELRPVNALPTLQKLKEIKRFNTPVVVLLDKNKEFIKRHYLEDGFDDYILRSNLEEEIKRIIDKYY